MLNKVYHSAMKDTIENWWGVITGLGSGGLTVTLLSINLNTLEGMIYFLLSSAFGGLIGYLGKKTGELIWNKLTKPKKNERIHQVDPPRQRDGDFE